MVILSLVEFKVSVELRLNTQKMTGWGYEEAGTHIDRRTHLGITPVYLMVIITCVILLLHWLAFLVLEQVVPDRFELLEPTKLQ